MHTVPHITRWKVRCDRSVGIIMTTILTFSEVRSLILTWWPELERLGSAVFTCAEHVWTDIPKNGGGPCRCFFIDICENHRCGGGVRTTAQVFAKYVVMHSWTTYINGNALPFNRRFVSFITASSSMSMRRVSVPLFMCRSCDGVSIDISSNILFVFFKI